MGKVDGLGRATGGEREHGGEGCAHAQGTDHVWGLGSEGTATIAKLDGGGKARRRRGGRACAAKRLNELHDHIALRRVAAFPWSGEPAPQPHPDERRPVREPAFNAPWTAVALSAVIAGGYAIQSFLPRTRS
jgi:hypothetical protein